MIKKNNVNFATGLKTRVSVDQLLVRFYRKSINFDLKLTSELEEIIIGLLLGDLFAEKIKPTSNTRLQFKQSNKNKPYIDHLYSLFKEYCNSEPKVTSSLEKRPGRKELNVSIKFWTSSLPCFNKFRVAYASFMTAQVKNLYHSI